MKITLRRVSTILLIVSCIVSMTFGFAAAPNDAEESPQATAKTSLSDMLENALPADFIDPYEIPDMIFESVITSEMIHERTDETPLDESSSLVIVPFGATCGVTGQHDFLNTKHEVHGDAGYDINGNRKCRLAEILRSKCWDCGYSYEHTIYSILIDYKYCVKH